MTETQRYEPSDDPSQLTYTFGGAAPVGSIRPGTVLSTWTLDCFAGAIRSTSDLVSQVCDPRFLNPQTGPFYVEGAEPGDTLAVHFLSIEPRGARGFSTTVPLFGALTATTTTAMLHPPLDERTWAYEIDRAARVVRYEALESSYAVNLPLDPMHGTVGVPSAGRGAVVTHPGQLGRQHGHAGDARRHHLLPRGQRRGGTVQPRRRARATGRGRDLRCRGRVCNGHRARARHRQGTPTAWPRLEDDVFVMTTGSARPLEDAFRIAHTEMVHWVCELTGLSPLDSYQLVSQAVLTPIANVVDTNYTVVAKLPKEVLGGATVMQGAHDRRRIRP